MLSWASRTDSIIATCVSFRVSAEVTPSDLGGKRFSTTIKKLERKKCRIYKEEGGGSRRNVEKRENHLSNRTRSTRNKNRGLPLLVFSFLLRWWYCCRSLSCWVWKSQDWRTLPPLGPYFILGILFILNIGRFLSFLHGLFVLERILHSPGHVKSSNKHTAILPPPSHPVKKKTHEPFEKNWNWKEMAFVLLATALTSYYILYYWIFFLVYYLSVCFSWIGSRPPPTMDWQACATFP